MENEEGAKVKVKQLMSKNPYSVSTEKSLHDATRLMSAKNISCLVITEKGKPIGVLTERDLIKKVLAPDKDIDKLKIKDVMTKNVITISPEDDFVDVNKKMKSRHIRHLPVVDEGKLVGVMTETDVMKESFNVNKWNISFLRYENVQSIIILILFIFIIIYFIWLRFQG